MTYSLRVAILREKFKMYIANVSIYETSSLFEMHFFTMLSTAWCVVSFMRGSPIGFTGFGICLISRPGFGILKESGDKIWDCNYDRDSGFGDFNKRESGNVTLKKPRFGNSKD